MKGKRWTCTWKSSCWLLREYAKVNVSVTIGLRWAVEWMMDIHMIDIMVMAWTRLSNTIEILLMANWYSFHPRKKAKVMGST
jgi:hypothetical protein